MIIIIAEAVHNRCGIANINVTVIMLRFVLWMKRHKKAIATK